MNSNSDTGVVLYTDGGANPNPGYIGWGVHGYLYKTPVLKPILVNNHVITNKGYSNNNKLLPVEPISYYDFAGSDLEPGTNNKAEILALYNALLYFKDFSIGHIEVFTDSSYVVDGINKWCKQWSENNWVKQDGLHLVNCELWKPLYELVNYIKARSINIHISWVKGHNEVMGNVQADSLATIGINRSRARLDDIVYNVSEAKNYWKTEIARHPFINFNKLYFNTLQEYNKLGNYYLANPSKDEEVVIGKRLPSTSYSVVRVAEPDPIIELVKHRQIRTTHNFNVISLLRLDRMYESTVYRGLKEYGDSVLTKDKRNFNLNFTDNKPVTIEVNPVGLSLRAIEAFTFLDGLLDDYIRHLHNQTQEYTFSVNYHDITAHFYSISTKVVKKQEVLVHELLPSITTANLNMTLEVPMVIFGVERVIKVPYTLGLDIVTRNALKKLEDKKPKITLITWHQGTTALRYATIIETIDTDYGIWSNYYSDTIYI